MYFDTESEVDLYLNWSVGLVCFCFSRRPEDGTPVPKHVGVDTYRVLYFTVCILFYFFECICWLIRRIQEYSQYSYE
jgi:hypothetical protein